MTMQPTSTVHSSASLNIHAIVLPRALWETKMTDRGLGIVPQKGTWYAHVLRGKSAHDVKILPMIGCPNCGGLLYVVHTDDAAAGLRQMTGGRIPVSVTHQVNHLGLVRDRRGGDLLCMHGRCDFHRRVYLDRWNKTKPLYAIAYVEGVGHTQDEVARGEIKVDYCHAVDRKEALNHFGARRNVRVIDAGPAVGFFVKDKEGKKLSAD